jgi:hypothetical protein
MKLIGIIARIGCVSWNNDQQHCTEGGREEMKLEIPVANGLTRPEVRRQNRNTDRSSRIRLTGSSWIFWASFREKPDFGNVIQFAETLVQLSRKSGRVVPGCVRLK